MYKFWTFFIRKKQFGVLIVVALVLSGFYSVFAVPKESTPEVEVGIAVVSTAMPGSTPVDVEKLITNTLEEPLRANLKDVKKITSSSVQNYSTIIVEFSAEADLDKSMRDLRDEVRRAKVNLPESAKEPNVTQIDLTHEPVITATVSASLPEEILFRLAESAKDELEQLSSVSSVELSGVSAREVQVLVQREALARHGIDLLSVISAISSANAAIPVGTIVKGDVEYSVRFAGGISDPSELASIIVTAPNGKPVYLRDIAEIVDGRANVSSIARTSLVGERAKLSILLNIFKASNINITEAANVIRDKLDQMQDAGGILEHTEVLVMFDRGELLWNDLYTLVRSGLQTTVLVIFVLALAVGAREALIAGLSIPLSFLVAFVALYYSGNTVNFISLFALVLAVGIIVDSAIVIVEGINLRLKHSNRWSSDDHLSDGVVDKEQVALNTIREFHVPLIAGTATTIAVFAPLLLVSGIVGEFIKGIPFTIIFILLASLFIALAVVPLVAIKFLRSSRSTGRLSKMRKNIIDGMHNTYTTYLEGFLMKKKNTTILLWTLSLFFVFTLALPSLGVIKVIFFGSGNSEYIFIDIEMPHGTVLSRTSIEARRVEEVLYGIPQIESFVVNIGSLSPFTQLAGSQIYSEKYANIFITLNTKYVEQSTAIVDLLRKKLSEINTSIISVDQLKEGPPSASPIVVTYMGESFKDLDSAADKTAELLRSIVGVTDTKSGTRNNGTGFALKVERDKAATLGVSTLSAGNNLRAALVGTTATTIKKDGDDIGVKVLLDFGSPANLEALGQVSTLTVGGLVPLLSFASAVVEEDRAVISHENGLRSVSVTANLTSQGNLREVVKEFESKVDELEISKNIKMRIGGENEDFERSFADMFVALIIGMVSMFAILILQFNSVRYALYVLLTVPLSLIGVFGGLMLVNEPVSFPSLMGFIALAGIVVNNAIIMIDTINKRRKNAELQTCSRGLPLREVVIDAAVERLRPVLLTAVTTVIGIIPLTFAASIWVPLAYSVMFGLSFSTIITLVLIPAIYYWWPGKVL